MDRHERAKRLREMLKKVAPQGSLESLRRDPRDIHESMAALAGEQAEATIRSANTALESLERTEIPTDVELNSLEAIVLPRERPVVFIEDDAFRNLPAPWEHFGNNNIRQLICAAIPSIGRIELPNHPQLPYGGTGFVVGRNLLMTNRHVAQLFATGLGTRGLTFIAGLTAAWAPKRERHSEAATTETVRVKKVLMIHPYWDMALLQVESFTDRHPPLKLSVTHPDDLVGQEIAVIGYPARDPRSNLELEDRIFEQVYNVKRLQPGKVQSQESVESFGHDVLTMTHDSSTLGGNSGSAVIDVSTGQIVGLHFAGTYLKANYAVSMFDLASDKRVVDAGLTFTDRVAANDTGRREWEQADSLFGRTDERSHVVPSRQTNSSNPQFPSARSGGIPRQPEVNRRIDPMDAVNWSIPLEVSVRIGQPSPVGPSSGRAEGTAAGVEAVSIDPDYSTREGYDPRFLGRGKKALPLPNFTTAHQERDAAVNETAEAGDSPYEFRYHHFSVVMNAARRLAYFTAVNIDGTLIKRPGRERDRWILDPRLPAEQQVDNSFYGRPFDRGHLVRRLDPAWGRSKSVVKSANDDTFHFTNCSPQHARFNEGKNLWAGLEDYVLDTADKEDQRVTVFTGCVFEDDDPDYDSVQIPRQFWKVMVFAKSSGRLSASGYVVSQEDLLKAEGIEAAAAEVARTFQVPIRRVESLTGLDFGPLADHDPLAARLDTEAFTVELPLVEYTQIVL